MNKTDVVSVLKEIILYIKIDYWFYCLYRVISSLKLGIVSCSAL